MNKFTFTIQENDPEHGGGYALVKNYGPNDDESFTAGYLVDCTTKAGDTIEGNLALVDNDDKRVVIENAKGFHPVMLSDIADFEPA